MKPLTIAFAFFASLAFAPLPASTPAFAGGAKVDVCHFPPGNPDNYQTIRIAENALETHLAHGDLTGACNALCKQICDDGDACTVDDTGDCEQNGCPVESQPVNCDDDNACTTDTCDSQLGQCVYTPIECTPSDDCHVAACRDDGGNPECFESPVVCDDPEHTCNPSTGDCEADQCFTSIDYADTQDLEAAETACRASAGCPIEESCGAVYGEPGAFACYACIAQGRVTDCDNCDLILRISNFCGNVCEAQ